MQTKGSFIISVIPTSFTKVKTQSKEHVKGGHYLKLYFYIFEIHKECIIIWIVNMLLE
jgi:hypothetical protein